MTPQDYVAIAGLFVVGVWVPLLTLCGFLGKRLATTLTSHTDALNAHTAALSTLMPLPAAVRELERQLDRLTGAASVTPAAQTHVTVQAPDGHV